MASSLEEFTTAIFGFSMSSALRPSAFQLARRPGVLAARLRRVISGSGRGRFGFDRCFASFFGLLREQTPGEDRQHQQPNYNACEAQRCEQVPVEDRLLVGEEHV